MEKTIRLTENDLHRLVKESAKRILNEISGTEVQGFTPSELRNMLGVEDDDELNAAVESEESDRFQSDVVRLLQQLCGNENIYDRLSYFYFPAVAKAFKRDFNLQYEGWTEDEGHVFDNDKYEVVLYPVDFYENLADFRLMNIHVFPSSNGGSVSEGRLDRIIGKSVKRILREDYSNMDFGFESPEAGKEVTIYQLDPRNPESRDRLFQSLDRLKRYGLDFNPRLYKIVYQGTMPVDTPDEVYKILQFKHPKGYNGHSLSVSDLVEMDGRVLFCDSTGWKDVTKLFKR